MSVDVGPSSDFAEKKLRLIRTERREFGVVRWNGGLYAVNNYCTHQGGPICLGLLSGRLESDRPGSLTLDVSRPVLACPWHGWEFDLVTGVALPDPRIRLRTFPVSEVEGRVLVDLDAGVILSARRTEFADEQTLEPGAA
jgi:nitrite reductase (NADH) small subunit